MKSDTRLNHEFKVFRDVDEACRWLGVDHASVHWPETDETG